MAKRRNTRNKKIIKRRRSKIIRGGDFSAEQKQKLKEFHFDDDQISQLITLGADFDKIRKFNNLGFNEDQIIELLEKGVEYDIAVNALNKYDYGNPDEITENAMIELRRDPTGSEMQYTNNSYLDDDTFFGTNKHMDITELDLEPSSKKRKYEDEHEDDSYSKKQKISGGRKSKRRIRKKGRKTRKIRTRKQRGGMCFGNGVGANSYDPNNSIYNTNMLKLFPYKATN